MGSGWMVAPVTASISQSAVRSFGVAGYGEAYPGKNQESSERQNGVQGGMIRKSKVVK